MAIPTYQELMLPLMRAVGDSKEHRIRDLKHRIADECNLTTEERNRMLPSGKTAVIFNRIHWARTYLVKAGLLAAPARGIVRITQRGLDVLAKNPPTIDAKYLKQFDEFRGFLGAQKSTAKVDQDQTLDEADTTPDEQLATAFATLQVELAKEVLEQVLQVSPTSFEHIVLELLVAMGYGGSLEDAARVVGRAGDGGIDGVIKEDRLGLDEVYVQAKRWSGTVGRPELQKFAGALQGRRARKGVFITTSSFSREAEEYVAAIESKIVLVDGERLAALMIEHDIGVSRVRAFVTKRLDSDYFEED